MFRNTSSVSSLPLLRHLWLLRDEAKFACGHDEHGDCRNYCSGQSGRSQLLGRRAQQLQKGKQQQGAHTVESAAAASSTSLFGSWLKGGDGGEGASASNHVKTEV